MIYNENLTFKDTRCPENKILNGAPLSVCYTLIKDDITKGKKPWGIQVMFSQDEGKTWSTDHMLCEDEVSPDLGYPATVELSDGSLLTVFYAHPAADQPAVIMQQKWRIEE